MQNPVTKFLKRYLNYRRGDRNALILIILLIIAGIIINEIIKHLPVKSNYDYFEFAKELDEFGRSEVRDKLKQESLFPFNPNTISEEELDTLKIPDFIKRNLLSYRNAGGEFSVPTDFRKLYGMNDSIYHVIESFIVLQKQNTGRPFMAVIKEQEPEGTFDPNIADTNTLLYFGFNNFQATNLIRYREKGGKFYQLFDLIKIYGIDSSFLMNLQEHILITETKTDRDEIEKMVFIIELNNADSVQLTQLNGIGPAFASRILKYRNILGGFYNTSQLLEVYNFSEETYHNILNYIKVDTSQVKKIRINFAQYDELIRHPYLNNEIVNSILKYREAYGSFSDISQLNNIPGLEDRTINKIHPYITCR